MGEYATRKSDNQEIKIGTCDTMYYLRYSDRDKVRKLDGNVDPNNDKTLSHLRFRLPYPDEDQTRPGEYEPFRGAKLYSWSCPENADEKGILQVSTKYGMLLNVPCYHGEKLPENTGDIRPFWNGRDCAYELRYLKFIDNEPWGVYGCIECGKEWRAPLRELIPHITGSNVDLKTRLIEWYCPGCEQWVK